MQNFEHNLGILLAKSIYKAITSSLQFTTSTLCKDTKTKNKNFILIASLLLFFMLVANYSFSEASRLQACKPIGTITGKTPPPGQCNQENDSVCYKAGEKYKTYECSPAISSQTRATLTINSFEEGGNGGGPSECDDNYHSNSIPIVALSTGWYNGGSRCFNNITIRYNGRSVTAMVVDECDSTMGCDKDDDYQPPCPNNIVDGSKAVWEGLGISDPDDVGSIEISWSED